MTIDRPQVGGGQIPVAPGTCEACVFGDRYLPHTCEKRLLYWHGMDPVMKVDFEPVPWMEE